MTDDWVNELKSITLSVEGEMSTIGPAATTEAYRRAREALTRSEVALHELVAAVAAQRRALPLGVQMQNYSFTEGADDLRSDGDIPAQVTLDDLFAGHDELVVYHLMFHPEDDEACPMCSSIVDGIRGIVQHLTQRCGLAVIAKAPLPKLRRWGRARDWDAIRLVSSFDNDFATYMGTEGSHGGHVPAVSVFTRDRNVIHHRYTASADFPDGSHGGVDQLWPIWHFIDLLPSGRTDWLPDNKYV